MLDGAQTEQELPVDSLTTDVVSQQSETTPAQPVDTGGSEETASETTPSTPPVENASPPKVDPRPRDEFGRFKPESDASHDPVREAIAKLSKPEAPAKPAANVEKRSEQKPVGKPDSTAKQPEATAQPDAKPAKPDVEKTDPLADLIPSDAEKAHWSEKTKARYDKLFSRTRELVEQREKDPDFVTGREFNRLSKEYALDKDMGFVPPEQLAGLIQVQGAINRALTAVSQKRDPAPSDLEPLKAMGDVIDKLRGQFGLAQIPTAPAPLVPFAGELPQEYKDLHEIYGIDEKRVRILAALEATAKAAPSTPPPQTPPQQVAPPPQAPPQQRPQGVDMVDLFARRLQSELAMKGDTNPTQTMRVLLNHPATKSEVMRRFPGTTPADVPAVFNALDARERYEVLSAAHTVMTKPVPKVPARPTPPPPTQQRTHQGSPSARRGAPDANGDAVASAIAFMAKPE